MTLRSLLCSILIAGSLGACGPTWTSTIKYSEMGEPQTLKRKGRCSDAAADLGPSATCTDKKEASAGQVVLGIVGLIVLLPLMAASGAKS